MKRKGLILVLLLSLICAFTAFAKGEIETKSSDGEVTKIVYWQYFVDEKKQLIDSLIQEFEKQNPNIKVEQQTFPYENYNTKVAASVPTGTGPNVINLYYGWLPQYINAGYLQPLPFEPEKIEDEFLPLVTAAKFDGKYYALPTAVRSLALFYNKDLFKAAGLDPNNPPKTLEQYIDYAKKLTVRDKNDNIVQAGTTLDVKGQIHNWIREVLIRQFGGTPYSDDEKKVTYDNEAGYKALELATNMQIKDKVSVDRFMGDDLTAFKAGAMAMSIDGSFRLGAFDKVKELNYGVSELPSYNGIKSNCASFWANGITKFTSGKELEASIKFIEFLTSGYAMERWLKEVGELPAKKAIVAKDEYRNDEKFGPFIRGLEYAYATKFVDELGQRQVFVDAWDRVTIEGKTAKEAMHLAAVEEQKILDNYYNK